MWSRDQLTVLASAITLTLVSGCDPGCGYAPVDAKRTRVQVWSQTISGVRFEHEGFDDLVPIYSLRGQLKVLNESDSDVVLVSARVEINGKSIGANPPEEDERRYWKVSRKTSGEFFPLWKLAELSDAERWDFGPTITWIYTVRIGSEQYILRVGMEQTYHARF